MIVVSDTTPLNYLVLIESVRCPGFSGESMRDPRCSTSFRTPKGPEAVRAWASNPPPWLTIQDPTEVVLSKLGVGETAAISLALELKAERVLIDDRDASREAVRIGLNVVGTLGILRGGRETEAPRHREEDRGTQEDQLSGERQALSNRP